jgi:transposase
LYAHVSSLLSAVKENAEDEKLKKDIEKYLTAKKTKSGTAYKINHKAVEKELESAGYLVLITNRIKNAEEALGWYRAKNVVEKGFLKLKNAVDLGRLRVHSQESMQNKIFIGFILTWGLMRSSKPPI